jgi:hypothetical protein
VVPWALRREEPGRAQVVPRRREAVARSLPLAGLDHRPAARRVPARRSRPVARLDPRAPGVFRGHRARAGFPEHPRRGAQRGRVAHDPSDATTRLRSPCHPAASRSRPSNAATPRAPACRLPVAEKSSSASRAAGANSQITAPPASRSSITSVARAALPARRRTTSSPVTGVEFSGASAAGTSFASATPMVQVRTRRLTSTPEPLPSIMLRSSSWSDERPMASSRVMSFRE